MVFPYLEARMSRNPIDRFWRTVYLLRFLNLLGDVADYLDQRQARPIEPEPLLKVKSERGPVS